MRKPAAVLTAALLASAAPLAAFTLVERGASFQRHVTLTQAALCDGSVRLAPGAYKLQIASMGDGSVRASFFDRTGRKAGEANGVIAIIRQGQAGAPAPGAASSVQKIQPAGAQAAAALNFSKLGFGENGRATFRTEGQNLKLEIFSADGTHSILIGLLLPAVQKGNAKLVPAVQKVREAAAQPN